MQMAGIGINEGSEQVRGQFHPLETLGSWKQDGRFVGPTSKVSTEMRDQTGQSRDFIIWQRKSKAR